MSGFQPLAVWVISKTKKPSLMLSVSSMETWSFMIRNIKRPCQWVSCTKSLKSQTCSISNQTPFKRSISLHAVRFQTHNLQYRKSAKTRRQSQSLQEQRHPSWKTQNVATLAWHRTRWTERNSAAVLKSLKMQIMGLCYGMSIQSHGKTAKLTLPRESSKTRDREQTSPT